MSSTPPNKKTFDRDEVDLILREAARASDASQHPSPSLPVRAVDDDGLTLHDIERAAAEVGIAPAAVAAASLRVRLQEAHAAAPRFHHVHEARGALTVDGWDRLASDIRTAIGPADIRRTADGLDLELKPSGGELGTLQVQIRSKGGSTSLSIWSDGPVMSRDELLLCGLAGAPPALFPFVAVSGGQWPEIGLFAALASAGAGVGVAAGLAWQRWRLKRWRRRLTEVVAPIALRISELAITSEDRAPSPTAPPP